VGPLLARGGTNTATLVQNALNTWVPDYDLVLVILNEPGFGGCGGGGFQVVDAGSSWAVMRTSSGTAPAGSPTSIASPERTPVRSRRGSISRRNSNRANAQVAAVRQSGDAGPDGHQCTPATGICNRYNQGTPPAGWSNDQDVGLFEGASYQ